MLITLHFVPIFYWSEWGGEECEVSVCVCGEREYMSVCVVRGRGRCVYVYVCVCDEGEYMSVCLCVTV